MNVKSASRQNSASGFCWRQVLISFPFRTCPSSPHAQVIVPKVWIAGPSEMYVDEGSQAVVECVMENILSVPEFVIWSFNGKVVSSHLGSSL